MRPLAYLGSLCTPFVPSTLFEGTPFPFSTGAGGGGIDCVATLMMCSEEGGRRAREVAEA